MQSSYWYVKFNKILDLKQHYEHSMRFIRLLERMTYAKK